MLATNRSWPGTSTNETSRPEGNFIQAKPKSMVRPRWRSCTHRSGSMPVKARTSVDLPWSTCPAVATTAISPSPPRGRIGARRGTVSRCGGADVRRLLLEGLLHRMENGLILRLRDAAQVQQTCPVVDAGEHRGGAGP